MKPTVNKNNAMPDGRQDFLKNLIQKSGIDKPTNEFTQNVMKEIEKISLEESSSPSLLGYINKWFLISISGLAGIGYLLYYFLYSGKSFITINFDPVIIPIFEKIFYSFKSLFQSFEISSFTLVIIFSVLFLFLIERLFRKFQTGKYFYFSF